MLDARYEIVSASCIVRDDVILAAIAISVPISKVGKRSILGVEVSLSEAEVYLKGFSFKSRGARTVRS